MGFFGNIFRRDQRAMPEPGSAEFEQAVEGSALPGSARMGEEGWVSATETAEALSQLRQAFGGPKFGGAMASADVSVTVGEPQTLDLRGMQGLRDEMLATLRQYGVDPDSGEAFDASQVPGLQEALLAVLARHGVDTGGS